jgi:hypothetical protein
MIEVPHRSVTRFFIPMIDVLTLLFCMFLLLPIMRENESLSGEPGEEPATPEEQKKEIAGRRKELEELRQDQRRAMAVLDELAEKRRGLIQQNVMIRLLYVSPKDGSLAFFDPTAAVPTPVKIDSAVAAAALIERHRKEAGWRDVFYIFQEPRDTKGQVAPYPTLAQENAYKAWFKSVNFDGCVKPPPDKGSP